jgi:hypothetical protein
MAEARKAIFGEANAVEWGTPVLYLRAADGHVIDVEPTHSQPRSGRASDDRPVPKLRISPVP